MARVTFVKKAQPRYRTVPVIDPATGEQKITPVLKKDGSPKTTKSGREIVMRVTTEDKTQPLPNRKCDKCGVEIKPGDSYKWTKTKGAYGGTKRFRCANCPTWQHHELSNSWSARVGQVTGSFDGFDGETEDDAQSILDDLAEQIRGLAEESRETAENVREGFGHDTFVSEQADERADELDAFADEIEGTEGPGPARARGDRLRRVQRHGRGHRGDRRGGRGRQRRRDHRVLRGVRRHRPGHPGRPDRRADGRVARGGHGRDPERPGQLPDLVPLNSRWGPGRRGSAWGPGGPDHHHPRGCPSWP